MGRRLRVVAVIAATLAAWAMPPGCSSEDETAATSAPGSHEPCKQAPWDCPEGETCWIDQLGDSFICQASGAGQVGDACTNQLGLPTCADGLACYHVHGYTEGVCSPFCDSVDPSHRCPEDAACRPLLYQLPSGDVILNVCEPPGGFGGSGGGGGGSASGGTGGTGAAGGHGGAG